MRLFLLRRNQSPQMALAMLRRHVWGQDLAIVAVNTVGVDLLMTSAGWAANQLAAAATQTALRQSRPTEPAEAPMETLAKVAPLVTVAVNTVGVDPPMTSAERVVKLDSEPALKAS